jgi:hypothetical protein
MNGNYGKRFSIARMIRGILLLNRKMSGKYTKTKYICRKIFRLQIKTFSSLRPCRWPVEQLLWMLRFLFRPA